MKAHFPNLWFGLLVGVAAGMPNLSPADPTKFRDIRLGDVLVCEPNGTGSGIVHYDNIKATDDGPVLNGRLAETAAVVTAAIQMLRIKDEDTFVEGSNLSKYLESLRQNDRRKRFSRPSIDTDKLYKTEDPDKEEERQSRSASEYTMMWYGNIGSGSTLGRNAQRRDQLRKDYDIIGLEMEAAGIMNSIAVGVIRGVCDYADGKKNKGWQPYAAATAAAYAKAIVCQINPGESKAQKGQCNHPYFSLLCIISINNSNVWIRYPVGVSHIFRICGKFYNQLHIWKTALIKKKDLLQSNASFYIFRAKVDLQCLPEPSSLSFVCKLHLHEQY
jgi:nucleoside phosphorylase